MKTRSRKIVRVYRVENLDAESKMLLCLSVSKDRSKYTTCLCLNDTAETKVFNCGPLAFDQLEKYKKSYLKNNLS